MSIRDRLRSSSSILAPRHPSHDNLAGDDDARVVTGVVLSCDDVSSGGDVHRDYKLIRGVHRAVDFIRATDVHSSGRIHVAAGGAARALFTSPVMSRKHARMTFAQDGSVTVMDVGSMHGTHLVGVDFDDTLLPERLKPRRHYTLRSGDTLLLGKPVNRDDKDWKPVTVRVTFTHDAGARFATPPPNRYGLYPNSAGASEPGEENEDEDAYYISSSSDTDGEDDDCREYQSGSSPATSPLASHVPLPLGAAISASASRESLVTASRSADDLNPASGVFALNRSLSASSALRAILPPMPAIQAAINRLPSLRELGIFNSGSSTSPETRSVVNEVVDIVPDSQAPAVPEVHAQEPDTTTHVYTSNETPNSQEPAITCGGIAESFGVEDDGTSGSIFAWQEPSHPQNQLGLELDEQSCFYADPVGEARGEGENQSLGYSYNGLEHQPSQMEDEKIEAAERGQEIEKAPEDQQDDVRSMDISPCSSRGATPTPSFRAGTVFDIDDPGNGEQSRPGEPEDQQHCRCHEQAEERLHQIDQQDGQVQQPDQSCQQQDVDFGIPTPTPVTPDNKRKSFNLTPGSAAELDSERRRVKAARFEVAFDPIPSPVSIGKRGRRSGTRVGPTRKSPPPNPPGPFGRVKPGTPKHVPDVETLRARVRSLEARVKAIRGSAIMMASVTASAAGASTSAPTASIDEARKEIESMREEMRRLSALMETLIAKIEARTTNEAGHIDCGVQASSSRSHSHGPSEVAAQTSGSKRKRTDFMCTLGDDFVTEKLVRGFSRQARQPDTGSAEERIRALYEPFEELEPDVRPAKRARVVEDARDGNAMNDGRSKSVMTVAAVAGCTGAALTWFALAYM